MVNFFALHREAYFIEERCLSQKGAIDYKTINGLNVNK